MDTGNGSSVRALPPPLIVTAAGQETRHLEPHCFFHLSFPFAVYSSPRRAAGAKKEKEEPEHEGYTKRKPEGQIIIPFSTGIHPRFLYIPFNFFVSLLLFPFSWSLWLSSSSPRGSVEDERHGFAEIVGDLIGSTSLPLYSTPLQPLLQLEEQRLATA
jgi:hypothetical protein